MANTSALISPSGATEPSRRVVALDILRGVALFGVLVVNFYSPSLGGITAAPNQRLDQAVYWFVQTFFHGKFYLLFSLLFGLGVAIQVERTKALGRSFVPLYLRRLLILFCLGGVHSWLLWDGDILQTYAITGLLLLGLRRLSDGALRHLVVCLLFLSVFYSPLSGALPEIQALISGRVTPPAEATTVAPTALDVRQPAPYATGSYADLLRFRIAECVRANSSWRLVIISWLDRWDICFVFVFGFYLGRRSCWRDRKRYEPTLYRALQWGLVVGCVGMLWRPFWHQVERAVSWDAAWVTVSFHHLTGTTVTTVVNRAFAVALTLLYGSGLWLLLGSERWLSRLRPIAAVGRLSLSNYLLISVLGTTLFYGYGLGLHGRLHSTAGLGMAILVYGVLVFCSNAWVRRFQHGAVEWFWKSLTYMRFQPMRIMAVERVGNT
ncbi:MAG: DUF418 domain-containing protein [Acidobacteria bacterium]|nr:DUF418 domain-containing protein [Acidobacteriota bacterium]